MIVCLSGSFRFYDEILRLREKLARDGINCLAPVPFAYRNVSKPSEFTDEWVSLSYSQKLRESKRAELDFLHKIDNADVLYVVNPGGYVGRSVVLEIGYAYAKGKRVFSMDPIEDFAIMSLTEGTCRLDELKKRVGS